MLTIQQNSGNTSILAKELDYLTLSCTGDATDNSGNTAKIE